MQSPSKVLPKVYFLKNFPYIPIISTEHSETLDLITKTAGKNPFTRALQSSYRKNPKNKNIHRINSMQLKTISHKLKKNKMDHQNFKKIKTNMDLDHSQRHRLQKMDQKKCL